MCIDSRGIARKFLLVCACLALLAEHSCASGLRIQSGTALDQRSRGREAVNSAVRAKSTLMSPDGTPLSARHAFTIPLKKSAVDTSDKMEFLSSLKALQIQMREIYADTEDDFVLLQETFVALKQQV